MAFYLLIQMRLKYKYIKNKNFFSQQSGSLYLKCAKKHHEKPNLLTKVN